jgi:hypothetical protein
LLRHPAVEQEETVPEVEDTRRAGSVEFATLNAATVFIDESYSKRDYYVAALLATGSQQAILDARFQELRRGARFKWGVPDDVEFHAHDIMQGRGPWSALLGRVGDAASLYRNVLRAVVDSGVKVAIQGVDVVRLNLRFQYPAAPYETAARRALEQVNLWCEQDDIHRVEIVADEIGPDLRRSQAAFARIVDGTTLAASSTHPGPLTHISGPISLVESRLHSGVQAADMVAHIVRRHLEETGAAPPARRLARSLHNTICPALGHCGKWRP